MIGNLTFTLCDYKNTRLAFQRVPRMEGEEGDRKAARPGLSLLELFEEWARICAVFGLAETPSPDFRTQMAAAVGMGMRLTGGYAVEILGAEEHDGILTIRYRERSPRPNEFVTQAVTAPFHVRLLPRSDAQRVRFERVAGTDG